MSLNLDIRTLFLVLMGAMIIQGATLLLAWRVHRGTVPALGYWALAAWVAAGCSLMFALRNQISPFLSIVVANAGAVAAYAIAWAGCRVFAGHRPPWLAVAGAALLTAAALSFYTHVDDSLRGRVIVASTLIAAFSFLAGAEMLRVGINAGLMTARLNSVVMLLHGTAYAVRAILTLLSGHANDLLTTHPMHSLIMLETVLASVAWSVGFYAMTSERIQLDLNRKATHDPLTGILNRRAFLDQAEREIRRAERTGESVSFLMIDIDRFKTINDTHGHAAGDRVIEELAALLASHLRAFDLLGRYGGEEFCILLANAPVSSAATVAERLRAAVERMPVSHRGTTLHTTISIGVAEMPADERSLDRALARADAALYAAKIAGRNQVASNRQGTIDMSPEPAV